MRRVLVVGMTGAGKTSAARELASRTGLPFHEMDHLAIGPGWSTRSSLVANVRRIVAEERWVFDSYGYDQVRDIMWAAADTVVWLDYSRAVVLRRVLIRSLRRSLRRERVFGGNVETWSGWLSADHPLCWAMSQLIRRRRLIHELTTAATPHIRTHHFRSPAQLRTWLATLGEPR